MKFYFCLICLIISIVKINNDCFAINPTQSSDCVLSQEDKNNYKYCCLEKISNENFCFPYDESNYNLQKQEYEETKKKSGEDYVFICNSSNYLKLTAFYIILSLF